VPAANRRLHREEATVSEHERCLAETPCGGEDCARDRCRVLVRRARSIATPEARELLAAFCEASWPKVLAIVRRHGCRGADAEDMTQAYFARFLERGDLEYAAAWQGSLEGFLNVSVRYFVSNERDRARAQKRGGGRRLLSLDETPDPGALPLEPVDRVTPETLLAQAQATLAIEDALTRLRGEMERAGGGARLARVERYLLCEVNTGSYRRMADEWGVRESAVRVAVHRLRRRLAGLLRGGVRLRAA
jgi:DNA-directed RNA polymerase specialized sigma24 family protein